MNENLATLIERYRDGVPVKVEPGTLAWLAATALFVVAASAIIIKYVKKL